MSIVKKIPERMCVVCRQMKPKKELIRIFNSDGVVAIDKTGKSGGRGVYVCKCKECITKALKNKGFVKQHGFSLETVRQELENLIDE